MQADLNPAVIPLKKSALLRIHRDDGRRIECLGGALWVTQDHDRRDIVLEPGQGFTLDRATDALVGAFADAQLLLLEATPAERHGIAPNPTC